MKKLLLVFGTRPEAIKMYPLLRELKKRGKFQITVCVTGQHREMLDQVMQTFGIHAEHDLSLMTEGQSLSGTAAGILQSLPPVLDEEQPDMVLVHGDTTTAFATALTCFYRHIPVGHVEAGLRSGDLQAPFPEEFDRRAISLLSTLHFAPTVEARNRLLTEGCPKENVFLTGNTVVDVLKETVRASFSHELLAWAEGKKLVFLTMHRRENRGIPMRHCMAAIRRVTEENPDVCVLCPVHPGTDIKTVTETVFSGCERIRTVPPLDVVSCHNLMARAYLILTDSGGLQEEACILGIPTLVLRDGTERREGVDAGVLSLAGTDGEKVYKAFTRLLREPAAYEGMKHTCALFGDGRASERISDCLENRLYGEEIHG